MSTLVRSVSRSGKVCEKRRDIRLADLLEVLLDLVCALIQALLLGVCEESVQALLASVVHDQRWLSTRQHDSPRECRLYASRPPKARGELWWTFKVRAHLSFLLQVLRKVHCHPLAHRAESNPSHLILNDQHIPREASGHDWQRVANMFWCRSCRPNAVSSAHPLERASKLGLVRSQLLPPADGRTSRTG